MSEKNKLFKDSDLVEKYPHLKDFFPLLDNLNKETPRGALLLACSYADELLKDIIQAFLIDTKETKELFEGAYAPIGTFSARIKLAYGLGLISEAEKDEILLLKKIRNSFAHDYKVTIDDPKIVDMCNKLNYSAKPYGDVVVGTAGQLSTSSVGIVLSLVNRAAYVSRKRLSIQEWPR